MSRLTAVRQKRIAAGILGMLLLLIMLFSSFYLAVEADHDCSGEDCPVCACIQQCENTLHRIGAGTASLAGVVIPVVCMAVSMLLFTLAASEETPVSRKVRLNN